MSWPLASHFSAMLQNPRAAFRDPKLQSSRVEKGRQNQPRPWAGAFAVVYKAYSPEDQRPFALRVFTSESPERRERYDLISAYMKDHRLRCLVEFEYRDQSIRSAGDGKWYPLILMDWVQGETLFQWVRTQCLAGDGDAIGSIADRWIDVVKELGDASIAHGDLQHANVMVASGGELKLVDYDCLCVPALVGRRNLEVGVQPYQHPARDAKTLLSLDLDHFSALLIYAALRALAADTQLWLKHVEQPGYDKLLFRSEDFQSPITSQLYRDLLRLPNAEVRELTEQLVALTRVRMDEVPPLGQVVHSYAKVERLLAAGQWNAAVRVLNRRGSFRDAPGPLRPLIYQAYEHVCRQEAWAAFAKIPNEAAEAADRRLVEAWNEALFADYPPAERERPRVTEARRRVQILDRLRHLAQQTSGAASLAGEKHLLEKAAQLPPGYRHSLQERIERAEKSVLAMARLEAAIAASGSETAIVAAWRAVQEAHCEPLVGRTWNNRVAMAQRRAPALNRLADVPENISLDQRDAKILALWDEETLADCAEAEPWREVRRQALARQETLERLGEAVARGDEAAIVEWSRQPGLAGYPLPAAWAEPIKGARARARRVEAMLTALDSGQPEAFYESFDVRLIRRNAELFRPRQETLAQWIRDEVLPAERLGLRAEEKESWAVASDLQGNCRVRWIWPAPRLADRCVLGVCPEEPAPGEDPHAASGWLHLTIEHSEWDSSGGQLIRTERGWDGAWVAVWAIVDVGFAVFPSRPLLLGRLRRRTGWNWKGLLFRGG